MKKFLVLFIAFVFSCPCVFAKTAPVNSQNMVQAGISNYKKGNYTGSVEILEKAVKQNPGNALAHYYLAMAYVKIEKKENAISEYQNVIKLNPNDQLAAYATAGLKGLGGSMPENKTNPAGNSSGTALPDDNRNSANNNVPSSLKPNENTSEAVNEFLFESVIKHIIESVNTNGKVDEEKLKQLKDFSKSQNTDTTKMPTDEEIANAVKTLYKLAALTGGANNINTAAAVNPEMMQMNMLMSAFGGNNGMNSYGGNNSSMNGMLPLMMMFQNQGAGSKTDPQAMQTLLSSMMMPDMFALAGNNNNNN